MSEPFPLVDLRDFADLRMGETIIALDCTGEGLPVYSADTSDEPWNYSSRCRTVNRNGCIVIGARGSIGHPRLPPFNEFAATQTTIVVDPNRAEFDPRFLLYALRMMDFKLVSAQQAVPMLTIGDLRKVQVSKPSRLAQRRIAEILGTVDEAIEQTEVLIAKQQQVKAGLMHDLFTRGVTAAGELRHPLAEAPHLYQDTPHGLIPQEWALMKCSEICDKITVGIVVRPTQYYVTEGIPAFRSANVRETGIDPSDLVFISRESNELLAKSQLKAGDVVSVRTGYPGTSAVVSSEFDGANCIDILISRPTSRIDPHFMAAWINSTFGKDQVLKKQGGLAQQHFNVGDLRNLQFVVPHENEQRAIVSRLSAMNQRIESEATHLAKLRQLKQGLMQDLLTGRVPVPASIAPAAP